METLRDKTLVMIIGPSAIGKSTLMNEAIHQHPDFSYVRSFTTRAQRPGEKSYYNFIDKKTALHMHETGQAITFFEHPTTGDMYGTTAASFPTRYNLLDTLSDSVAGYRELPFQHTITISLTALPEQWREWFLVRYPVPTAEALKRIQEASLSINWSLNNPESYWLENTAENLPKTAAALVDIIKSQPPHITPGSMPRAMLELIEKGLWHKRGK